MLFVLSACTPDNVLAPETEVPETEAPKDDLASPPVNEQSPDSTQTEQNVNLSFVNPEKAENKDIMPTADIDKFGYDCYKTTELKDKELSFYVSDKNAFNAGELNEKQWMDALSEKFGIKLNYTVRLEATLLSSQSIAQKSGIKLDVITTRAKDVAPSLSLMRNALMIDEEKTTHTFSKRTFEITSGKVFTANGMSKMMWYNKNIVSDAKAYDYFEKDEWTDLALGFLATDIREAGKNIIECDNWAIFGSAAGVQATGIASNEMMTLALDHTDTIESFSKFAKIFENQVADKKNTFKKGGTAFCYTDKPVLSEGELGFVPVPAVYGKGLNNCELSGIGMGVSKTADDETTKTALTFLLLWSTRYSEARADELIFKYGLTPQKANRYIQFTEACGNFYNSDSEISSIFETSEINPALMGDPSAVVTAFQSAYDRVSLHNIRIQ